MKIAGLAVLITCAVVLYAPPSSSVSFVILRCLFYFLFFFFPFYYAVFGIVLAFKKCRISIRFYHFAVNKGKKKKDDIGNNYYVIDEKEKSKYFFMFGYFVNTRNSFRVTNVRS